jgi:hypothetical protein
MKRLAFLSVLGLGLANLQAGGFGGPPPFTNGSPLSSGTDGTYQIVASATNVTGIISFAISNGIQTSSQNGNSWVFFVDGQILSGQSSVNLSNDKVTGILDAGVSGVPVEDDGTVTLPISIVIPGNAASGTFSGSIDLNSPIAAMEGKGLLTGTPARTDQILIITGDENTSFEGFLPDGSFIDITGAVYIPVVIPGSSLGDVEFKFRGSRVSLSATAANNSSSSSTTTN